MTPKKPIKKNLVEKKAPTFEDDKKEIDKKIKQAEKRKQKCIDELYVLSKRKQIIWLQQDIENKLLGKSIIEWPYTLSNITLCSTPTSCFITN